MLKRIILFSLILTLFSLAQSQTVESKKCKTCGKPLKECQYKGKHTASDKTSPQKATPNSPSSTVRMDGNDIIFSVDGKQYRYKMVYVEGGVSSYRKDGIDHKISVGGFYIGQTEVTQALWKAVMGKTVRQQRGDPRYGLAGEGPNYPMYYISWDDCRTFILKLNELTGLTFRLPTEPEWFFASHGGNNSRGFKYSGSDNLGSVAWYEGNRGGWTTHPVAQKLPNELGLYDMIGNVLEFCGEDDGRTRGCINLGGSVFDSENHILNIGSCLSNHSSNHLGLRLAMSAQ